MTEILRDLKTVLRFLSTIWPQAREIIALLDFLELVTLVRPIDVQDPNYNAPVGNSPANI